MPMLLPLNRFLVPGLLIVFLIICGSDLWAQCCSTGNPVGASTNVGILDKSSARVTGFFRNSYSEIYYEGSKPSEDTQDMANNAHYSFSGISVEYGVSHRITAQLDMGYFFNKIVDFRNELLTDHNGQGLSNGLAMLKYGLYINPSKKFEVTTGLGLKFPFGMEPKKASNGTLLQLDARPSTNAFGLTGTVLISKEFPDLHIRTFLLNRYEYNFSNKNDYMSGQLLLNSLFVSKRIVPRLFGIIQLRNELHGKDIQKGEEEVNTGYHLLVFTPQLSYSIGGLWNLSFLYDIPVFKNYQGKQLTPQYSFAFSLAREFKI